MRLDAADCTFFPSVAFLVIRNVSAAINKVNHYPVADHAGVPASAMPQLKRPKSRSGFLDSSRLDAPHLCKDLIALLQVS